MKRNRIGVIEHILKHQQVKAMFAYNREVPEDASAILFDRDYFEQFIIPTAQNMYWLNLYQKLSEDMDTYEHMGLIPLLVVEKDTNRIYVSSKEAIFKEMN